MLSKLLVSPIRIPAHRSAKHVRHPLRTRVLCGQTHEVSPTPTAPAPYRAEPIATIVVRQELSAGRSVRFLPCDELGLHASRRRQGPRLDELHARGEDELAAYPVFELPLEPVEVGVACVLDLYARRGLDGGSGAVREDLDVAGDPGLRERTTSATADG